MEKRAMDEQRESRLERGGAQREEAGAGQDRVPAGGARIGDQPDASATDSSVDAPAELAAGVRPVDLEGSALSDADVAEFRRRIADGVYNSREVADEVARRMLQSGDI